MYLIETSIQGQNIEKCEKRCGEKEKCQFYFYTDNNWCSLYSSCDNERDTGAVGSTFKKLTVSGLSYRFYSNQM